MTISAEQISVGDIDLAKRVLAYARNVIAPRLDEIDGEALEDALAILKGVVKEATARGARGIVSQSVGTARVSYVSESSCFSDDDRQALAVLAGVGADMAVGHPVGDFPKHSRVLRRVFPEGV